MFDDKTLANRERECDVDAAILTLFREWREAMHRANSSDLDDETRDAECIKAWGIQRRLYDTPATGAAGLAIKAYMLAYEIGEFPDRFTSIPPTTEDSTALGTFNEDHYNSKNILSLEHHALRGLVMDAVRFVPDLTPLAVGIADAPVTLQPLPEEA